MDKYQGQQNDYVLVSLVRSDRVGHFRDVRRLVVALSRARLGLYVFGKVSLFSGVWELKEAFGHLLKNPTALSLNIDEVKFETTRAGAETGPKTKVFFYTKPLLGSLLFFFLLQLKLRFFFTSFNNSLR